jgi:hypothetical protein
MITYFLKEKSILLLLLNMVAMDRFEPKFKFILCNPFGGFRNKIYVRRDWPRYAYFSSILWKYYSLMTLP